jgi:beta-lactamase regulating signal transducer with metallopeptidase domain
MNLLSTAALLALVHASIVIVTTIFARLCVPSRLAAVRATVGVVGLVCVLAVTALALLPLPGLWPSRSTVAATVADHQSPASSIVTETPRNASDIASPAPENDASPALEDLEPVLQLHWLTRLSGRLQIAAEAAPARRGRTVAMTVALAGLAVSLARLLVAIWGVHRLRRASWPVEDTSITEAVAELARRCGYRRALRVHTTDQLQSAAACGWLRPMILLPADWRAWTVEERAAVLAHEVAHIGRADYLRRLLAMASAAVHFYHPLVRAVTRRVAVDQEFAADRLARRLATDEAAYARGLARLALRYHNSFHDRPAWSNVSIMPRSSDFLARRLEMLRVKDVGTADPKSSRWITFAASTCY